MIKNFLSRFRGSVPPFQVIHPETAFVAIGDIHGRLDLLESLLGNLGTSDPVVCVGDYVDRGDNSAQVLRLLQSRPEITSLMGNHEEMLLRFLDDPLHRGSHWLRNGGLQTLASFKISGLRETATGDALVRTRDALRDAMGEDLIGWLRGLPSLWQTGNVAVVHAGADPALPMANQPLRTLHWGHEDFRKVRRTDGIWVVHGHTIVDAPSAERGRIAIDTGAYATGRLTAVHVTPEGIAFGST